MSEQRGGDLKRLYRSLSPARRKQLLKLVVLVPVVASAEMLMIASIVPFLALLSGKPNTGIVQGLLAGIDQYLRENQVLTAAALFAAAAIVASIFRLWLARSSLYFAADLGHELNTSVQRRMLHQPYLYHASSHSSRLLASLEKVDQLVLGFALKGLQAIGSAFIGVAVLVTLLLIDPLSAAISLFLVAGLYGLALFSIRLQSRGSAELAAASHERRIRIVQDSLAGIRDIIIDRSQDARLKVFEIADREYAEAQAQLGFLAIAPRYIIEGLGIALLAAVALALAQRPGGLPAAIPVLGALALGAQRLLPLASQLYGAWVAFATARPMVREILNLLSLPLPEEVAPQMPLRFEKAITFDQVGFHYPDRSGPALHDLNLAISRGSKVAIVGRSGSGKSTLADLLMGLLEPTEGQIRVDKTLITGGALARWRQSVAHVPQVIFVADASIAANIAFSAPSAPLDMEKIRRAATVAQLDEFVRSLPAGYETQTGERGVRLSGGQRQRLALARAIYKQAPLLVLDEATSALDEATEGAVLDAIDKLQAEGATIIVIAHRLSTVQRCKHIFMLDQGALIQAGTFTELFGRLNRLHEQGDL